MAQTIIVDISTRGANPVAYTHQGDTGRTFFAEIYENGVAFAVAGYTIKVGAILPADRGYYVIAGNDMVTATKTNDNTTNKIYFTLSDKYSLKAGNGILTLIFTSNTGTPSTIRPINIDLRIQKSADADDTIAGASDFPAGLQSIATSVFQEYLNTYLPPVAPSSSAAANKAADAKLTGEALDDLKSDLYQKTDNLIRFDDTSFWEQKDLDGTSRTYAATTADFIPVTGGAELYTALKDLDTDIFGTVFNIHVRQYDSENNVVVSDTTYSSINTSAPTHYTLNASTTKIKVMLTTNNWQKTFTLDQLKALNPLIYVGFNSSITNATVYRMYAPIVSFLEEEYTTFSQSVNASIGTINYGDFEYQADRYISGNGNIATDTSTQHAVLIKGLKATEGDEFVVYCETPRPSQPYLAYCAYSSITDLRAVTAIGSRVATTDIFLDTGKTYIVKIEFTVPSGAKTVAISFRTYNNAKWIILRKSDDPLKNSQLLNIHNILMDSYSRTVSNELIENVSNTRAINHRGYNSIAPENTLPAFKLSRKKGFKYVETDVRFTSDGVAVLLHDDTINRTARNADGTELSSDVYINAITYEQALTYDFGIWKSSDYAETRIPTFEQFVALCRNIGVSAYVEIKAGTQAQVESLVDIAVKYGMDKHITWNSFDVPWLEYVKNYKPNARIGVLANTIDSSIITSANGLKTNSNEVFINASISTITEENVALAIANDLPIEAWTVYVSSIPTLNPYVTGMTTDKDLLNNYMFNKNID